jgi:uncharacterized membrane protein SirB2
MIALSCIILILSGTTLMVIAGVGPFAQEPWSKYHLAYKRMHTYRQDLILYPAILFSIICSLILIGVVR